MELLRQLAKYIDGIARQGPVDAEKLLVEALSDWDVDYIVNVHREAACTPTYAWCAMNGELVDITSEFPRHGASMLSKMPPALHYFAKCQRSPYGAAEISAIDRDACQRILNRPIAFGWRQWADTFCVPIRIGPAWEAIAICTTQPMTPERKAAITFFTSIYAQLRPTGVKNACGLDARPAALSSRQLQCLRLAAEGVPIHAIAAHLDMSARTVRYHLNRLRRTYGYATNLQAIVRKAMDYRFLAPSDDHSWCR
jgi:LuxR family transcriptional regulator of spore coat protein